MDCYPLIYPTNSVLLKQIFLILLGFISIGQDRSEFSDQATRLTGCHLQFSWHHWASNGSVSSSLWPQLNQSTPLRDSGPAGRGLRYWWEWHQWSGTTLYPFMLCTKIEKIIRVYNLLKFCLQLIFVTLVKNILASLALLCKVGYTMYHSSAMVTGLGSAAIDIFLHSHVWSTLYSTVNWTILNEKQIWKLIGVWVRLWRYEMLLLLSAVFSWITNKDTRKKISRFLILRLGHDLWTCPYCFVCEVPTLPRKSSLHNVEVIGRGYHKVWG